MGTGQTQALSFDSRAHTLSQFPSRSLKDSPHFEKLKNVKAVENEIWVQGRRAEAGCEIMQLTVGSVTEMGL